MIELCSEYLCASCIWLYVLVMSRTPFRVNPDVIVASISKNSFIEGDAKSEVYLTATWLKPITTYFVKEHSTIWINGRNDWAVFWVLIFPVHLTVCLCHVTYAFESDSILYSWINVKELIARSRREIWSVSNCNWTQTHNHLVRKGTLNHLAERPKWLSYVLSIYLYVAFACMFLSCHVRIQESIRTL